MTCNTTTKEPSRKKRITTAALQKRLNTIDKILSRHTERLVKLEQPPRIDPPLKGSEIGEKEEPWMVGDLVTVSPYVSYGPIQGKTMPIRDIDAVQSGFIGMTMPDGSRCSTRAENITRATPAEVQIYQEQVKAQEWARDTYETDRRSHLSRIQELEDQVKALRDVGGVMAGILTKHAADVGVRDLGEVEAVTAWDNLTASKPSNNNTGS